MTSDGPALGSFFTPLSPLMLHGHRSTGTVVGRAAELTAIKQALSVSASRRVAVFVDDLQWADDDSLRFLRYVLRADSLSPLFLMASVRPEELAFVTEAVNLIADMERMGVVRRLRIARFRQVESTELLKHLL